MSDNDLLRKLDLAIWIGKSLFERGKTSGASANLSFAHEDRVYITATGTCFGNLTPESFSEVDRLGVLRRGPTPSRELLLHLKLYGKRPKVGAVIHTHSFYAVLWSCLRHASPEDVIPSHTPYLKMRLGTVGLVPFAPPGSKELFELFAERIERSDGYLLAGHGPVVGGDDLLSAFYNLEELEESARVAWALRGENAASVSVQDRGTGGTPPP
ncbi:MAG: class II aldolase/adducin family protein [Synergistaceae bacterium]|jgi:ribulose-5-phosphate 4-epimerase/fuculose-1-phosphate aldolase|nr:class II aldolase/adducin family protein [Synergistaceae bacterium]